MLVVEIWLDCAVIVFVVVAVVVIIWGDAATKKRNEDAIPRNLIDIFFAMLVPTNEWHNSWLILNSEAQKEQG